jgi:uncharacterized protein YuzE
MVIKLLLYYKQIIKFKYKLKYIYIKMSKEKNLNEEKKLNETEKVNDEICIYMLKTHKIIPSECIEILNKLKYLGISGSKKEETVQRAQIIRRNTYVVKK